VPKIIYFHTLNIAQMWLNIFMNDHHLSNITKLKKKHQVTFPLKTLAIFLIRKGNFGQKMELVSPFGNFLPRRRRFILNI
jgi:hypothetical protein